MKGGAVLEGLGRLTAIAGGETLPERSGAVLPRLAEEPGAVRADRTIFNQS